MSNDVTLPGTGERVETLEQADGSHRQVIALGEAASAALIAVLHRIANPMTFDPTTGSTRVLASGSLTTVTTVTNIAQLGGIAANLLVEDMMRTAWATSVRGRIT